MGDHKPVRKRRLFRPGLRMLMLLVGLTIMAMPISGLYLFRIYENELVRQTESELIAQGALAGAMLKEDLVRRGGSNYGRRLSGLNPALLNQPIVEITPRLDLSRDEIRAESLSFTPSPFEPDPLALAVGPEVESVLKEAARTTLSRIHILDNHGVVVAGWSGHGLSMADNTEVKEALNGHYHSLMRERAVARRMPLAAPARGAGFRVFCAMPVMNGDRLVGVVHLSRTPREILKALYSEGSNVIWAAVLSLGLMAAVSLIVSLMIIRPIRRLADDSKAAAEGRGQAFEAQTPPRVLVRELAELRLVVADMAGRLRHRSDYLKAFASGVSHEFKTPLTSIKGAMELLSEHGGTMDQATRARFEGNIKADLDRLERLVARLLTLARAEAQAEEAPAKTDRADLNALLQTLAGLYQSQGYQVELEVSGPLELAVAADVLETVLRNLFDNSRDAGATISFVEVEVDTLAGSGEIYVSDNGPGISDELLQSIFKPFFTTHKNHGGTGLGLSLARTLLAPFRGELHLTEGGPGATFVIILPLVQKC